MTDQLAFTLTVQAPHVRGSDTSMAPQEAALVSHSRLLEALDYNGDTGLFFWRIQQSTKRGVGGRAGCDTNSDGYVQISIDRRLYKAHRLAWFYVHGRWPAQQIDHINGIRSDNRIANLREASVSDNARNRRRGSNNTSGLVGVSRATGTRDRWSAYIHFCGRQIRLGNFATREEAAVVYQQAARRLFGEFARLP